MDAKLVYGFELEKGPVRVTSHLKGVSVSVERPDGVRQSMELTLEEVEVVGQLLTLVKHVGMIVEASRKHNG